MFYALIHKTYGRYILFEISQKTEHGNYLKGYFANKSKINSESTSNDGKLQ